MTRSLLAPLLALAAPVLTTSAGAQPVDASSAAPLAYADLVDMAAVADVAAVVTVKRATWLKDAAGVAPGNARLLIEAEVTALLRGKGELPPAVQFLADVPLAGRRPPKLKDAALLVLGDRVANRPAMLQLVGPRAMMTRTDEAEARLRGVLTALVAPDAPPRVTGISGALHVPGSLPGESETQIFLRTADARPISLSVLRRPGEAPRFAVALGELVDDSAAAPRPGTLLHYRLACGLPSALPDKAVDGLSPDDSTATRADYDFVLRTLGPCGRTAAAHSDDSDTPTPPQSE